MIRRLDAALHRLGDDPLRRAAVEKTLGTLAFADDDFEAAVEHFERARQLLVRELGPDHGLVGNSHQNLGTALYRVGRLDAAPSAPSGPLHPGPSAVGRRSLVTEAGTSAGQAGPRGLRGPRAR